MEVIEEKREELPLIEKVISIRRVTKVVAGGRRLRFTALVAAGYGQGKVGVGLGKADEVPEAIRKGSALAQNNMIQVVLKGTTIPHSVTAKYGAAWLLLKPANQGTGIIAGSTVRAVLEAAGIKDIVTKSLKSSNSINLSRATLLALSQLKDLEAWQALLKGKGKESSGG